MVETLTDKIKRIYYLIRKHSQSDVYLYGSSLRNILLANNQKIIDINVYEPNKKIQQDILKEELTGFNVTFKSEVDYSDEFYTIDNIYCKLEDKSLDLLEIKSSNNGLVDLNKKIIKLTKSGKTKASYDYMFVLDTIYFIAHNKFILDSSVLTLFMQNKQNVLKIEKYKILQYLKNIVTNNHPRKIVSLFNLLGISKLLFGVSLRETSITNNISKQDTLEALVILFSDFDEKLIETVTKYIPPKEAIYVKTCINIINNICEETDLEARSILSKLDTNRIWSFCRLLNAMKYKKLRTLIKNQRHSSFKKEHLCIDSNLLKEAFHINDEDEIERMLDIALNQVMIDPTSNEKYKLLSLLNKERSSYE